MSATDVTESPVRRAGATIVSPFHRVADVATRHERLLWSFLAVVLVADVLLTNAGLAQGLREGNPIMRWAIGAGGIAALVLAKAAAIALGVAVRLLRPRAGGLVPAGLAAPWLLAVAVNAVMIA